MSAAAPEPSSQALLTRLRALLARVQGVDFAVPEDTGYFSVDDDLVRQVRLLLERTVELLHDTTVHYERESEARAAREAQLAVETGEFLREIGAAISSELAARELANLAFVARGQLREIQGALAAAIECRELWAVVSHADRGLRRAGKALIALESAVCEYEGLPIPDRRWVDLDDALEIRRLYAQFRRAVLRAEETAATAGGGELAARLRSAGRRITILRKLEIYPFLRIDDRKSIRALQKRIVAWLDGSGGGEEDGRRLWQDLVAFARLLSQVNEREELREHDRQTGEVLYHRLFVARQAPSELTSDLLVELERLQGRDDDLDEILLHPTAHTVADLREPIERLTRELRPPLPARPPLR